MTDAHVRENTGPDDTAVWAFPLWFLFGGATFLLFIGVLALMIVLPPAKQPPEGPGTGQEANDTKADIGLGNLVNQPDLENCKAFFAGNAAKIVKLQGPEMAVSPAILALLSEPQKQEILQKGPTKLDAHYLEEAFFFREAASRLNNSEDLWSSFCQDKNQKKITRFFTWVCRLVAFQPPHPQRPEIALNPILVLKRGWGSGLDRALVFLTLFEQASDARGSVSPILLALPTTAPGVGRYLVGVWSAAKNDFWLLDPELGLPLELVHPAWGWLGPIVKAPDKIPPFRVNQQTWNLEAGAIANAKIHLFRPLSSLSPRLHAIETLLAQNGVTVTLSKDSRLALADTEKALESAGLAKPVSGARATLWNPGIDLLRQYTSPDEGGSDEKDLRLQILQRSAVPLDALPPYARIDLQLGVNPLAMQHGNWLIDFIVWDAGLTESVPPSVAERIVGNFARPFLSSSFEPGKTKDQLLRGKFAKLISELVSEGDDLKKAQRGYETNRDRINKEIVDWVGRMEKLYAAESRAKRTGPAEEVAALAKNIEESWKAPPVLALIYNAWARSRGVEVAYLLAIIRQEEAERMVRGKVPEERFMSGWQEASAAWKRFNEDLGTGICVEVSRSCWAEAVFWSAEKNKAIAILEQSPRNVTALQKKVLGLKAEALKRFAKAS